MLLCLTLMVRRLRPFDFIIFCFETSEKCTCHLYQLFPKTHLYSGMICEVACVDDGAARFIQKRLRLGTIDEKNLGLSAIFADLEVLWRNQHGSFLLQGIFEFGSNQMRKDLIDAIHDLDVVELCMHVHG